MAHRTHRRWRAALLVPLVLALTACADDAPLDTLTPKGPEAQTIHNLVVPVFAMSVQAGFDGIGRRALHRQQQAAELLQGRRIQSGSWHRRVLLWLFSLSTGTCAGLTGVNGGEKRRPAGATGANG